MTGRVGRFLLLSLLPTLLQVAPAAAQIPPDARWRTFDTPHFRVTFPEGIEPVARRAADRAEKAYAVLSTELVDPPRGRIELVVADNMDLPNGLASPLPFNRVVVYAHPPVAEPSLRYYEDWLQLVILHELVHIFHLDTAEGIWERLRSVFGRSPALFPQFLTPGWFVEGLATAFESRLTPAGRVRGTNYDMVLRAAVLEDALFGIDRATSDPIRWPAGTTRYAYGAFFIDHLVRRYGAESVASFIGVYGGRLLPYRLESSARRAFGTTFSREWAEWADTLRARYGAQAAGIAATGLTRPEMLTAHGRIAFHPRYAPNGAAIAYAAATGTDEPSTRLILGDGRILELERRTTAGPSAWLADGRSLLTARHDFVDPYRIYADLHRIDLDGGDERLTRGARVWDPDPHPNGNTLVVVANAPGTNVLALHDLRAGTTRPITAPSLDVHWSLPRWSPDGTMIAVGRWSRGGLYDVVILDTTGTVLREPTHDRAIDAAPAWSPDGRYLVFSSDRTGVSNLFAYDLADGALHQITNVLTGATYPDVSPDGKWIAFSMYGAEGYDIARVRFDPGQWRPAPPPPPELSDPLPDPGYDDTAGGPTREYSPFPTVLPTAWSVIAEGGTDLGIAVGAAAYGQDVVERHVWSAEAAVFPQGGRLDGGAAYRYRGLGNPVLVAAAAQRWGVRSALGQVVIDGDTVRSAILRRDRRVRTGATWVRRRWRAVRWLEMGLEVEDLEFVWDDPGAADAANVALRSFPLDLAATLAAGYNSARAYGVAIGPQEGFTASGRIEGHRYLKPLEGEDAARGFLRGTTRGRAFTGLDLPGFARHVLALRVDGGAELGSRSPGFSVGGASSGASPVPAGIDLLGARLGFPIRGYPAGVQEGDRAFSASAEYRFPIALVERGLGLIPVYLGRVWGDLFVDAGSAWCGAADDCALRLAGSGEAPSPLYSLGTEVVAHLRVGFLADLPIRLGAAVPLSGDGGRTPVVYVRLGRSF